MSEAPSLVRVRGVLDPSGQFSPLPGWETMRIAHELKRSAEYAVDVLDGNDNRLTRVQPQVSDAECWAKGERRSSRVDAYVPLLPGYAKVVLRQGERLLYETDVAQSPPRIRFDRFGVEGNTVRLQCSAEHDRDVVYNIAYFASRSRAFPLALGQPEGEVDFDLAQLPGSETGHVVVIGTDGLRSGYAISDAFSAPGGPARVAIGSPADGSRHPYGEAITLVGQAVDAGGDAVDADHLVWRVDDEVVARGVRAATATALTPGRHAVSLELHDGEVVKRIDITIDAETKEQTRWRELFERFDAATVERGQLAALDAGR